MTLKTAVVGGLKRAEPEGMQDRADATYPTMVVLKSKGGSLISDRTDVEQILGKYHRNLFESLVGASKSHVSPIG